MGTCMYDPCGACCPYTTVGYGGYGGYPVHTAIVDPVVPVYGGAAVYDVGYAGAPVVYDAGYGGVTTSTYNTGYI